MFRVFTRYSSLVALCALGIACAKSAEERAADATEEQQRAERAANKAASDTQREIVEANRDAAAKADDAQREANERTTDAIRDGSEKVAEARKEADSAARDASEAFQEARADLRKSVESQLDGIDERVVKLRKKLDDTERAGEAQIRTQMSDVELRTKTLRGDLQEFETKTATSVDQFKARLDKSLADLKKKLEELESRG